MPVKFRDLRLAASALAGGLVMMIALAARADDVVLLKNGGRIRGTVVSEEPTEGVKIKLSDGRIRAIRHQDIESVRYEGQADGPAVPKAAALPPAPAASVAPPAAIPPPPPPPPRFGSARVVGDEPGTVSIDGASVGSAPHTAERLPVGAHFVAIAFDAGGSDEAWVTVAENSESVVSLHVSEMRKQYRLRTGVSFGVAVGGLVSVPIGGATAYAGGRITGLFHYGLAPAVDLRLGAFGGAAAGDYGSQAAPVGGLAAAHVHAGTTALIDIGIEGGYLLATEIRKWRADGSAFDTAMERTPFVGPALSVGAGLGKDRRWEVSVRERIAKIFGPDAGEGMPGLASDTSLELTYLFAKPRAASAVARAQR